MHWSIAIAQEIVAKRKEKTEHVVATGITPSGAIHLGNLREIIIADAVTSAIIGVGADEGVEADAKLIYIADTFDPLRRRYSFLPPEYENHVGKPLSEIPDPDPEGRFLSYADSFLLPFFDSLDDLGIQLEILRADELYKSGQYVDAIKVALSRKEELSRIIETVTGRRLSEDWSPFNPLCDACGRITAAVVKDYVIGEEEAYYECECGNKGIASFRGGGKLAWRVDWAARWKILGITVEPFGKDHAAPGGSFETGRRISSEIYNYEVPYPIPFEHILLKQELNGEKAKVAAMSSSRGTNIPVHKILKAVPPEVLKHLILRVRPEKHIEFNPTLPLLNLIDEYEREIGGIGRGIAREITFRHLVTIVQIARGDSSRLRDVIERSGYVLSVSDSASEECEEEGEELKEIEKKARYVENWLRTYAPESVKFDLQYELPVEELRNLSGPQKDALRLMAQELQDGISASADEWHNKIYTIASTTGMDVKEVFKAIYIALLKKPSGPRAGWLLASLDLEFLKERFEAAGRL
ncbi:MAG: lysine--tRNA ligase [Methanophagales archaeon]|nr:lysine--tRNA ligase [Methanophagales archaeon]